MEPLKQFKDLPGFDNLSKHLPQLAAGIALIVPGGIIARTILNSIISNPGMTMEALDAAREMLTPLLKDEPAETYPPGTKIGYLESAPNHKSVGRLIPFLVTLLLIFVSLGYQGYWMYDAWKNEPEWWFALCNIAVLIIAVLVISFLMNQRREIEAKESIEEARMKTLKPTV